MKYLLILLVLATKQGMSQTAPVFNESKIGVVDIYTGILIYSGDSATYLKKLKAFKYNQPQARIIKSSYQLIVGDTSVLYVDMKGNLVVKNKDKAIEILLDHLIGRVVSQSTSGTISWPTYFTAPTLLGH